jgi:hypothetical protein|tara:strand:+ start:319 stop:525 length:207 start_codon:yes stop_codon:yes gene_type:complete
MAEPKLMQQHFNLINQSSFIQNINQGKTGLMQGIYSPKQKIEPLKDVSNTFYADNTKAQSNYMDRRKI